MKTPFHTALIQACQPDCVKQLLIFTAGVCLGGGALSGCSSENADTQTGYASYYHDSLRENRTASGERYKPEALTAAHRVLPLGTRARVINLENNKSVVVIINDRGPQPSDRLIDLSRRAAREIDMLKQGIVKVRLEVLDRPSRE